MEAKTSRCTTCFRQHVFINTRSTVIMRFHDECIASCFFETNNLNTSLFEEFTRPIVRVASPRRIWKEGPLSGCDC